MSQTGGCSCGCGGHAKQSERDERATAPEVAQPLGEGYRPQPVQTSPEDVDAVAVATCMYLEDIFFIEICILQILYMQINLF